MASPHSEWKLRQTARKTLSLDEDDPSTISDGYLQVLNHHLQHHPEEDNFLVDDDGWGTITCLDCWCEVRDQDVQGNLKGFDAFWAHIATSAHRDQAAQRLKKSPSTSTSLKQGPIDVDMDSATESTTSHRAMSQAISSASPATGGNRRRVMKTVHFPDGEVFEYSTDEDEQPPPMLQTPSTSSGYTSPFDTPRNDSSSSHPSKNASYPPSSDAASTPLSNNQASPSGGSSMHGWSSDYNQSPVASGSGIHPENSLHAATPTKRPRRGVRRHEFASGEIFYLSTDDETVDDRPGTSRDKRPRLGGALIKNEHGITKREHGVIKREQGVIKNEPDTYYNPPEGSWSVDQRAVDPYPGFPNVIPPDPAPQESYQPANYWEPHAAPHYLAEPQEEQAWDYEMQQDDQWIAQPYGVAMPGGDGPGMGYHAPLTPAGNPLPPGQAAGYDHYPTAGSFNLISDLDGPMGHMDVGGPDHFEKLKDFFVTAMEDFQETPKVVDAAHELGLPDPSALLPGLEVQLMPHQLIGVSWMVKQEAKPNIRGGILADDMGLGKTVQSIATCVKNPPKEGALRKSTLIVAPAALLEQWAAEFRERTVEGLFRVHIHHGTGKLRSVNQVRQYDVIITTYQTLCTDFPKDKKGKGKAVDPEDYFDDEGSDALGPLAATEWHRVVLDEAQCVRNRRTRSSRCVASLDSTYKWALTGTPVTNTLADIYALVRFLQFRPFNDWKEFSERIAKVEKKRPDLAGQRAQALLKKCLLRRTKYTKLEGKLILQLPPKQIEVIEVEFSPEEREIYAKVEEQQRQRMSRFLKAGTVMKNYAVILVMLLRLRQVCNHPQLITSDQYDENGHRVVESEDGDQPLRADTTPAEELKRAEQLVGRQFIEEAKSKLREQAHVRIQAEIQGTEVDEDDCPICFDTYVNNCRITSCKHLFCSDCLNDLFKNKPNGANLPDAVYADGVQDGSRSCPVCRGRIDRDRVFKVDAFEPSAAELDAMKAAASGSSSKMPEVIDLTLDDDVFPPLPPSSKGKEKAVIKNEELADLLEGLDKGDEFEPSTKMLKMMEFIKEWHQTAPNDKIICYSQWTSMIDLVETLLARDQIQTARFDGRMSRVARDDALARFKRRDGPSIMLISLKCGGVGLNLVEANRVLCLDLAWNAATENQAFDRVHRMGQHKHVHVKRLVVRNTVEQRILNLQATKQSLADAALGEGKAQKIKKMSVHELKALFGM